MPTILSSTLTYTIANFSSSVPAEIRNFTFVDNANIRHHADLSDFGLSSDFTATTTLASVSHNYVTGSPLRKLSVSATFPVEKTIKEVQTSTTLILNNTTGLSSKIGWVATSDDGSYNGTQSIVSVTSATWVVMSGTPLYDPTLNGTITFTTSTNEIVMDNTSGLIASWTITGNGYTSGMGAKILEVRGDNATLVVDQLPVEVNWTTGPSAYMIFTTSTKFLTVDSASGISIGWFASGNTYNGTQEVLNINGNTLTMSGYPGGYPTASGAITFSNSNGSLITIAPGVTKEFKIRYENATDTLGTWTSILTINANQGTPVVKTIDNYVIVGQNVIYAPPLPDNRVDIGIAGRGGREQKEPTPEGDGGWTFVGIDWGGVDIRISLGEGFDSPYLAGTRDIDTVRMVYQKNIDGITYTKSETSTVLTTIRDTLSQALAAVNSLLGNVPVNLNTPIAVSPPPPPDPEQDDNNRDGGDPPDPYGGDYKGGDSGPHSRFGSQHTGEGGSYGNNPSSCFLPDAIICMADGSYKKFIDLKPGDLVIGAFGEINPIIGIYYHPIGDTPMYKINNDHDCTDDEVFVTVDKQFYCINPAPTGSYNHREWGDSYLIHLENGISEMQTPPWSLGLISRPLHKVELGIKLQTTSGERILNEYVPYHLSPETIVYNCVVGGSHTLMINGYAHTAWARDDDFDYDQWIPKR